MGFFWLNNTDMFIFENHNVADILASLEEELAKGINETRAARADLDQAHRRTMFALAAIHHLKQRLEPKNGSKTNNPGK